MERQDAGFGVLLRVVEIGLGPARWGRYQRFFYKQLLSVNILAVV